MDNRLEKGTFASNGLIVEKMTTEKVSPHSPVEKSSDLPTTHKCVIIVDHTMAIGFIANTASVLSLSIGKQHPEIIGKDINDSDGHSHHGITILPVPVLKGTAPLLHHLREQVRPYEHQVTIVDLIDATRTTQTYMEYSKQMLSTPTEQLIFCGMALYGPKKLVNKFTGNLGLLR